MCYYITATLPEKSDIESIRTILDRYNMAFSPISNSYMNSQLRPRELYFRATKDYCDCDTSLGFLNRDAEYLKLLNSKKVKTLRKKKWSDSQIDEWIMNKLQSKPVHSKRSITEKERNLEIKRWFNFISEVINSKKVVRIGILKHWYKFGVDKEEIILKKTVKIHLNEVKTDFFWNLEENVLYEFFPNHTFK